MTISEFWLVNSTLQMQGLTSGVLTRLKVRLGSTIACGRAPQCLGAEIVNQSESSGRSREHRHDKDRRRITNSQPVNTQDLSPGAAIQDTLIQLELPSHPALVGRQSAEKRPE